MKLSYDPRYNIAYITLRDKSGQVETLRISESLNIDMAPDGTVCGIELLNANEQLMRPDAGHLVIVDESSGETRKIVLAS